jgi:hypothetical protein
MQTPDEQRELEVVIERLTKQFPSSTRAEIEGAVTVEYLALADNPIRDFVPVLVERQAKRRLKATQPRAE